MRGRCRLNCALPNMRLKLPGAIGLMETVGSCLAGTGLRPAAVAPAGESTAAEARSVRWRARKDRT